MALRPGTECCYLINMQFSNYIQVTYVIEKDIATVLATDTEEEDWPEKLYATLATTMAKQRAQLRANAKHPFNTYWYEYKNQYKKKKQ